MGRALVKLSQHTFPTVRTSSVDMMLRTFQTALGDRGSVVDEILADPTWDNLNRLPLSDFEKLSLRATTRNTAVPTIIHGGHRINVIPGEVDCDVDGRILPGQDPDAFRAEVQQLLGDEVAIVGSGGAAGIEADPASPLFDTIRAVMGLSLIHI